MSKKVGPSNSIAAAFKSARELEIETTTEIRNRELELNTNRYDLDIKLGEADLDVFFQNCIFLFIIATRIYIFKI